MGSLAKCLIASVFMLSSTVVCAQVGTWSGQLDVQGMKLPLVFHFDKDACVMDSPSQGAKGIKAEKECADGKVKVVVPQIGAKFEGTLAGDSINGIFMQSGMSFPLTLVRGGYEVDRPQTPTPPFPYSVENVTFSNDGFSFNGTLVLPPGCTSQTPVVLMITGSGQQNRDEEMFEHKPFAVIADDLARHGIASLRYDDRGYGDTSVAFYRFTTDDFRRDALAALALLRKRFDKVGVLGHSEGGTIALMLAAEGKADFIVSLAGMAVSGEETLVDQNQRMLLSMGLLPEMADSYCKALKSAFGQIAAGKSVSEITPDGVPTSLQPLWNKALAQVDSPYLRYFITIDTRPLLVSVRCPVLALNGTKDTQVDCDANLGALENGLTSCKKTIKAIDGLNHLFQKCVTGSVAEYSQITETISPDVLALISEWILSQNIGN